jgi:hypothetical protein
MPFKTNNIANTGQILSPGGSCRLTLFNELVNKSIISIIFD